MRGVVSKSSSVIKRTGLSGEDSFQMEEGDSLVVNPLTTQVGGHSGFLKLSDYVLKPLQEAQKGKRERGFYENVEEPLSKFVPKYFGILELQFPDAPPREYLVLQDIAKDFVAPTIMDIKIGRKTYGPDASQSKIQAENAKYSGTKGPFGLSFVSLFVHSIHDSRDKCPRIYDRNYGRKLKTEDILQVPSIFFDLDSGFDVRPLIRSVVEEIKKIRTVFEAQVAYNIFSSSLLIVYDTHMVREWIRNPQSVNMSSAVRVKIIDFAHAHQGNGQIDNNFLFGINSLISLFEKFAN